MKEKRKYADRAEYIKKAVSKRRAKIKDMAIAYKGGKCFLCGYSRCKDALEFHHLDSNSKEFGVSKDGLTRSWERVKNEIENCVLVCANCHRELHNKRSLSKKFESEK
jgi:5-methylcytosine-specific restriction endonuclease McrA